MNCEISLITNPLGRYWEQPIRENILIDETHALMSKMDFDKLYNYECSFPTGAYLGKMWRRNDTLFWWGESEKGKDFCISVSRKIIIV